MELRWDSNEGYILTLIHLHGQIRYLYDELSHDQYYFDHQFLLFTHFYFFRFLINQRFYFGLYVLTFLYVFLYYKLDIQSKPDN